MTDESDKGGRRRAGRIAFVAAALAGLTALASLSIAWRRYPPFLARDLAWLTGKARFLPDANPLETRVERSNWPQSASVLPKEAQAPLTETNRIMRIDELRRRPSLLIEGATLVFGPDTPARIAVSKLTLRSATLVTNGADFEIEVETLVSDNSEIRAFTLSGAAPAKGAGHDAGHVRLVVHGQFGGVLRVDLNGQAGGAGAAGRAGQPGAKGAKGENARAEGAACLSPAGAGGQGGPGGPGGAGDNGASGGAGGQLTLIARDPAKVGPHIDFRAEGGSGGAAGAAGPGGEGGPGGPGGEPAGTCIGQGPTGPRGADGLPGAAGQPGAAGPAGAMRTLTLGEKP